MLHFIVGVLLRPYADLFLERDLLNKTFRVDTREKDKLVSSHSYARTGTTIGVAGNTIGIGGSDSTRSFGQTPRYPTSKANKVANSQSQMQKLEQMTASGAPT